MRLTGMQKIFMKNSMMIAKIAPVSKVVRIVSVTMFPS